MGVALAQALEACDEEVFRRAVLAPETTRRVLNPSHFNDEHTAAYIRLAIQTEYVVAGRQKWVPKTQVWSALGDAAVTTSGAVRLFPRIDSPIALDFGSPSAAISVGNAAAPGTVTLAFTSTLMEEIGGKLKTAVGRLARASPSLKDLVDSSLFAVVFSVDQSVQGLSSGSTPSHIGRMRFSNAQMANDYQFVEIITHECTHNVIHMLETEEQWIDREDQLPAHNSVVSPWSGRSLSFRKYLEANFVWYGLYHLWKRIIETETLPPEGALPYLREAAKGFHCGSNLDRLGDKAHFLNPKVQSMLTEIQTLVLTDALEPFVA